MGRHSAPDDDGDDRVAADAPTPAGTGRTAVQVAPGRRPLPGRHAPPDEPDEVVEQDDDEPRGLEIIEQVFDTPADDDGADAAEFEDDVPDPDVPARPNPVLDVPEAADETAKIPPVVDAERDAPVPEAVTEQIPAVGIPGAAAGEHPSARRPAPAAGPTAESTDGPAVDVRQDDSSGTAPDAAASDLALLRRHARVRARVIAAVLVPFVLYVAVLVTLAEFSLRTFLIWIWVPLISAGVLAGLILDTAQRRPKTPPEPESADDQTG